MYLRSMKFYLTLERKKKVDRYGAALTVYSMGVKVKPLELDPGQDHRAREPEQSDADW